MLLGGVVLRGRRVAVLMLGRGTRAAWLRILGALYRLGELVVLDEKPADEKLELKEGAGHEWDREQAENWDAAKAAAEAWLIARGMLQAFELLDPGRLRFLGNAQPEGIKGTAAVYAVDCGAPGERVAYRGKQVKPSKTEGRHADDGTGRRPVTAQGGC